MKILITGGASGLGESITRKLACDSNSVIYFTYNKSLANAQKIESEYSNTISVKCDFKNNIEVNFLKDKISDWDIDVLINNAYTGSFIKSYFHKTSIDDFLCDFKDNIIPTILVTQSAINCFRKKKNGKIITILTSALVNKPPIGASVYVSNKAYLEELTKVWAVENEKFKITSNSVSPSFMLTDFTKNIDPRIVEQIRSNHPQKKLLTVEEAAESIVSLVNADQQVNGQNIILDSDQTLIKI